MTAHLFLHHTSAPSLSLTRMAQTCIPFYVQTGPDTPTILSILSKCAAVTFLDSGQISHSHSLLTLGQLLKWQKHVEMPSPKAVYYIYVCVLYQNSTRYIHIPKQKAIVSSIPVVSYVLRESSRERMHKGQKHRKIVI